MAIIQSGSCIGVLYRQGNQVLVHNGRFRAARYGNTWQASVDTNRPPNEISIAHWNIGADLLPFLERDRRLRNILQVALTPDLPANHPFRCANFRNIPPGNRILPGTCVGVWFRNPNGTLDIKNGRYLYWLDNSGRHHCVITPGENTPTVCRYHYVIGRDAQNRPFLRPEIDCKSRVNGVFRTTF
jgi:hypothetical protein